jgi:glycosyltransferase involved in cell wall biosynthesis
MNIAFITSEYITENNFAGGLSNYLYKVSQLLVNRGHKVIIVVASNQTEQLMYKNVSVYRTRINHNALITYFLTKILKKYFKIDWYKEFSFISQSYKLNYTLKQVIKKQSIDIIQYASYMATGYFKVKNIPAIVRISSFEPLLSDAYSIDFKYNDEYSIGKLRGTDYLEISALKKADALFCPSYLIARKIEKYLDKPVKVIESPYLPDKDNFDLTFYNAHLKSKQYLLFYGAVGILKGVHIIGRIINQLFAEYSDLNFAFIGKDRGYGDEKMMDYIYRMGGDYRDRIIYSSELKHAELFPVIANCYAVVLPSRIDNLPNTCIEAFSFRKIVIGTMGASFEQLINDGENGFLCNIEDPDDLLLKIKQVMLLNPKEKQQIEENAFNRLKSMTPDVISHQLLDFYNTVIFDSKKI